MIRQHDSFVWVKANALSRYMLVYGFSRFLPWHIVTEYPKSGGTWVSQMLSDYMNIPFPRNGFPKLQSCIIHGHYLYFPSMRNVFVVLRDGRDVMVSFYYHCLFKNDRFNARLVEITRREVPFSDYDLVEKNLAEFIEYKFTRKKHPRFTWSQFVNSWRDREAAVIKYENLLEHPVRELGKAINKVIGGNPGAVRLRQIVEKYSFKNVGRRDPGEESKYSFLRKGIAGDWKNVFDKEAKEVFNYYAGRELIKLGYEKDDSWVYM